MTQPEQPSTTRTHATGWPPWRTWLIAANTVTILTLVAVHAWHAGATHGVPIALLGLTRLCFAISAATWAISEVVRWAANRVTTAVLNHIDQHVVAAVDQLRRQLAADLAGPLGQLADAVEDTGARVNAAAERVAEYGDRRYLEGSQRVIDSLSPGGDVLPMPRRHAGLRNGGPVV